MSTCAIAESNSAFMIVTERVGQVFFRWNAGKLEATRNVDTDKTSA